jgi:phenylalanyl-tRNA synthetase alpha chain
MHNLDQIVHAASAAFAATDDPDALEQVKASYLGKSGEITDCSRDWPNFRRTSARPPVRPSIAPRTRSKRHSTARREALRQMALAARLAEEALDVTLPGRGQARGGLHPVTRTLERIEACLLRSVSKSPMAPRSRPTSRISRR